MERTNIPASESSSIPVTECSVIPDAESPSTSTAQFQNSEILIAGETTIAHDGSIVYSCHLCEKVFRKFQYLEKHLQRHGNGRTHNCSECDKSFKTKYELTDHLKIHKMNEANVCDECGKRLSHRGALHYHKASVHNNTPKHSCEVCKRAFNTAFVLRRHMLTHKDAKQCETCTKKCKRMNEHQKVCRGIKEKSKAFSCDDCQKVFSEKRYLKEHVAYKHRPERYQCGICAKCFGHRKTFNEHKKKCI